MNGAAAVTEHLGTRILFFTGKGGVGKTSLACAVSVALALEGKRVLLVSTDPASNLDEVLGVTLTGEPTPVPGAAGLSALNINPDEAAKAYRERVVGPYRQLLPPATVASMEEQLSGACTVEIAAFDEFTKLLGSEEATSGFDRIVFDTAPTGHTLRLLALPAAWTGFLAANTSGASCLGPLSGLTAQRELYESSLRRLSDASLTTVVLVTRPSVASLAEAARTHEELAAAGLRNQRLFVNGVFAATDEHDPIARALVQRQTEALDSIAPALLSLPRTDIPLLPFAPIGIGNLMGVFDPGVVSAVKPMGNWLVQAGSLKTLIDELEEAGRGLIMTVGKGGVGKTTIAAAIAVELARRGHPVQLSTTDPAAHVDATVGAKIANLNVSRIDPAVETGLYVRNVLAKAAEHLDAEGIALLEEDLRSPCTEEIAVFHAFAKTVQEAENTFVVLDTAPTGHTVLLLDAAEAYHREVARTMSDQPEAVRRLLPRLRDAQFTRTLIVTLAEATPVHEAAKLASDLERAGIRPFTWVVNQTFATYKLKDPTLAARAQRERKFLADVQEHYCPNFVLVSWAPFEPCGPDRLSELTHGGTQAAA